MKIIERIFNRGHTFSGRGSILVFFPLPPFWLLETVILNFTGRTFMWKDGEKTLRYWSFLILTFLRFSRCTFNMLFHQSVTITLSLYFTYVLLYLCLTPQCLHTHLHAYSCTYRVSLVVYFLIKKKIQREVLVLKFCLWQDQCKVITLCTKDKCKVYSKVIYWKLYKWTFIFPLGNLQTKLFSCFSSLIVVSTRLCLTVIKEGTEKKKKKSKDLWCFLVTMSTERKPKFMKLTLLLSLCLTKSGTSILYYLLSLFKTF